MTSRCIFCKRDVEWINLEQRTFSNGTEHVKGTCPSCGYRKFLPKNKPPEQWVFHFGKHKGKNITEVPFDYLLWGIEKDIINGGMAFAAIAWLKKNNIQVKNYRV